MSASSALALVGKTDDGKLVVRVPFELKDEFKKKFRSAKWQPASKTWAVAASAKKRVEQFIDEQSAAAAQAKDDAAAAAERLAGVDLGRGIELKNGAIRIKAPRHGGLNSLCRSVGGRFENAGCYWLIPAHEFEAQADEFKRWIEAAHAADEREREQLLEEGRLQAAREREQAERAAAEQRDRKAAAEAARAARAERAQTPEARRAAEIVDARAVADAIREMQAAARAGVRHVNRVRFEDAQEVLREERDRLRANGLECVELSQAVNVGWNRITRGKDSAPASVDLTVVEPYGDDDPDGGGGGGSGCSAPASAGDETVEAPLTATVEPTGNTEVLDDRDGIAIVPARLVVKHGPHEVSARPVDVNVVSNSRGLTLDEIDAGRRGP